MSIISQWLVPMFVKDIQAFLRFCNFYCRFILGYSHIALPMTELTCTTSRQPFQWTPDTQQSFKRLKEAFSTASLLTQFRPREPTFVETDASNFAISGILSQKDNKGHKHPIMFYSRKMTATEHNYGTPNHELLTIVASFKA